MKEKLNKIEEDRKFEQQKSNIEEKNNQEEMNLLKSKFSEMLAKNPIVVYNFDSFREESKRIEKADGFNDLNEVKSIYAHSGGGQTEVMINFNKNETYIRVNNKGYKGSNLLDSGERNSRITNDSFQNILTMVNELLEASNCPENDKAQLFQYVVDNFKGKILKDEDLANIK